MKKIILFQISFVVIMLVLIAFVFIERAGGPSIVVAEGKSQIVQNAARDETIPLINPVVASGLKKHFIIDFQPLRAKLNSLVKDYKGKGYIYFSYLNNGAWVGLNERELITAASTVKVPIAITAYKAIEDGKLSPDASYTLSEDDLNSGFGDLYELGTDKTLALHELMKIMLVHSDNTAADAIMSIFNRIGLDNPLDSVYSTMGWVSYGFIGQAPINNYGQISLKVLSNMFLALYNAAYITPTHSQAVLEYLSKTPFDDQIDAGVPEGITVAHKIGVYDSDLTYSDCGIVYAPNRNYLLCVASVGVSDKAASAFIANVSKSVYDYVMNN